MKKSDLKSGDIVVTSDGDTGMVLLGTVDGDIIGGGVNVEGYFEGRTWGPLEAYNEDLARKCNSEVRIDMVYRGRIGNMHMGSFDVEHFHLIWRRPAEPIEITLKEIAEVFDVDVDRIRIKE